ncbi:MAG: MoxR family ATPase [Gammaproteobacteria bacterium]|nr:MoxR family ATPase [Gammaproteobacteria bacterium]MDE0246517.1 MoxR family ATPase [Gammaproteobacteria bacterium]
MDRPDAPFPLSLPDSVGGTAELLAAGDYVADRSLATALYLALSLSRPLFLEGEAGVGKTEVAKVLARTLGRKLIRLQCYEGLDTGSAVYEWNYPRQMIALRIAEVAGEADPERLGADIFSESFLIRRPLLEALERGPAGPPVLLIDEVDRTDEPFEAFLLEVLSDFQITIPEIGTVSADERPVVVLTSNRTREIHDALKRRCLYHWIDYPDAARELEILEIRVPGANRRLTRQVVGFVQRLRRGDLYKAPGIAESIDWTRSLMALDRTVLDEATVTDSLGVLLKYQDDIARVRGDEVRRTLAEVNAELAAAPAP